MSVLLSALGLSLSGFYVDVSAVVADSGVEQYGLLQERSVIVSRSVVQTGYSEQTSYSRRADNPYVRLAIGFESEQLFGLPCRGYAEIWHLSSAATGRDRGINAGVVGGRCSLFGVRR